MIIDLVSPWMAAVEAGESSGAEAAFRRAHADLFDPLGHQRVPLTGTLPLGRDPGHLEQLRARATDPALLRALRAGISAAAEHGADHPARIVLLAGDQSGQAVEILPHPAPTVALFLDRTEDDRDVVRALACGLAAVTRWCAADSASPVRGMLAPWDRWQAATRVPLAEWLHTEGVGLHLAAAMLPEEPPRKLLGVSATAWQRLREREKTLRADLAPDLDRCGVDVVVRWLGWGPDANDDAGRYLAWRLVGEKMAERPLGVVIRDEG
jgi:hypothetical protein